jgi:hypothetical protein
MKMGRIQIKEIIHDLQHMKHLGLQGIIQLQEVAEDLVLIMLQAILVALREVLQLQEVGVVLVPIMEDQVVVEVLNHHKADQVTALHQAGHLQVVVAEEVEVHIAADRAVLLDLDLVNFRNKSIYYEKNNRIFYSGRSLYASFCPKSRGYF